MNAISKPYKSIQIFQEIMNDYETRTGFICAFLKLKYDEIKKIVLLDTNLKKLNDDKQRITYIYRSILKNDTENEIEIIFDSINPFTQCSTFKAAECTTSRYPFSIRILDYIYINDTDNYHTSFHGHNFLNNSSSVRHIIELPKLQPVTYTSNLYDWCRLIKYSDKREIEIAAQENQSLNAAYKLISIL